MTKRAKGTIATARGKTQLFGCLLCTCDPAHRLELVANDTRVDFLGVDVKLIFVPWYAQIPKDISAMYACCTYGKQYEELLQIAKHFGRKWYTMVTFCETRFAQSVLKIYVNFENNYDTYCRVWCLVEDEEHASEDRVEEDSDSVDDDLDAPMAVLMRRELDQQ
jgi:hypothetical protein